MHKKKPIRSNSNLAFTLKNRLLDLFYSVCASPFGGTEVSVVRIDNSPGVIGIRVLPSNCPQLFLGNIVRRTQFPRKD